MAEGSETDHPVPFGYKIAWVALPAFDGLVIGEAIGLKQIERCSWKEGIKKAYKDEGVFVTPTIDKWTLAIGSHPDADGSAFLPYLEKLSARFGGVFYFGTHRVVGYNAWAHAQNGQMRRAFGYLGERGEFLVDVGKQTTAEIEFDIGVQDIEHAPGEEDVLSIAAKWVFDPRELDSQVKASGPGWFGKR